MQKKSNTPVQSILRFIHSPPYFSFVNKIYQTIQFSLATALLFFMTFQAVANDTILVIHSYHTEYLWTEKIKLGIDKTINKSHQDIDVYHEFMDAKRYARNDSKLYFYDYIRNKFSDTQIDLIMVSDDPALDLALQYRESLPGNPPLVFLGINHTNEYIKSIHGATGVFENHDLAKTINEIKRQTKQEKIIIINDTTESGKAHAIKMQELLKEQNNLDHIIILEDLTPDTISQHFDNQPISTPVYLIGQLRENNNQHTLLDWKPSLDVLANNILNPIYTNTEAGIDNGAIGANILDGQTHGQQAAAIALRVLNGEDINRIPEVTEALSTWFFDDRMLKKYTIDINQLPKNKTILFNTPSFYEKNKLLVWGIGVSFAISFFVILLLIEIIRRGINTKRILCENESRYKDLANAGASIFWETDINNRLSYISGNTEEAYRLSHKDILHHTLHELIGNNRDIQFPWIEYNEAIKERKPFRELNFQVKHSSKEIKIFQLTGAPIFNKSEFIGYRGISREITKEHNLSETITYQASYDSLTGLVNRLEFNNRLKSLVMSDDSSEKTSYLCFLDLDRFKLVNDTAGHLVGDRLLVEVSNTLQSCIRSMDTLGRLGGDEFGLLLTDINKNDAQIICNRIIGKIESYRFQWDERIFDVGVSIGMIRIKSNQTEEELLSKADFACYKAKELGRGRIYIVDENSDQFNQDHAQIGYISNVTQAIERGQFYLVKQKIAPVDHSRSSIDHYEILLRYNDAHGKAIPPSDFIPFAEKHGVITIIDRWVLESVIRRYEEFFPDKQTMVSINLSGLSISNSDFVTYAAAQVRAANFDTHLICFEITETAAISHLSQALKFISTLKKLGVKFALDDFGCGASSFGYLKNLPVDYLKIDGSLVKNMIHQASDRAIVSAVNSIAQMMGMETIAEFVEDDQILLALKEIGVDYAQGYGIGKPEHCIAQR